MGLPVIALVYTAPGDNFKIARAGVGRGIGVFNEKTIFQANIYEQDRGKYGIN